MKYIKVESYEELSKIASNIIASQVILKPNSVLGLATGSSPLGIYSRLIKLYESGNVDFSKVTTVNLDEYMGLTSDNEQSYRYFMNQNLFEKINIDLRNTYVPNGLCKDVKEECELYDKRIQELGGIDIQLLGIGLDGHIGFNEPDNVFVGDTHLVDLTESTIDANSRFFNDREEVPKRALTMGMKSIMQARKIIIVANGEQKKEILEKAIFGEITPLIPASILQLHPDVTVIYSKE